MKAFLLKHWRTITQIIAWALLFISGGSSFSAVNSELASLKAVNAILMETVDVQANVIQEQGQLLIQLQEKIEQLQKENQRLLECLARPLPWPGGTLCPPPQEDTL